MFLRDKLLKMLKLSFAVLKSEILKMYTFLVRRVDLKNESRSAAVKTYRIMGTEEYESSLVNLL